MTLISYIFGGHARSQAIKKHVIGSFFIKGCSILLGFVQLPLTLKYLSSESYGVWVTLSSIVGWFYYMDIGLGNGLRNKLAEAFSKNDRDAARVYVSTAYAIIVMMSFSFLVVFLVVNHFLDWTRILNTSTNLKGELHMLAMIVFSNFAVTFVLQIIRIIVISDQKPAYADCISLLGGIFMLTGIIVVTNTTAGGSLVYVGAVYTLAPILAYVVASVYCFSKTYSWLKPTFTHIRLSHAKNILTLGMSFFIIQLSAVMVFSTSNIIIAQVLGPKEVTPYNIASKYFGIITIGYSILIAPFWSSFTDAYYKRDFMWIQRVMKKLNGVFAITTLLVLLMVLFAKPVFAVWLSDSVEIPFLLSVVFGVNVIIVTWSTPYVSFINGTSKTRMQLIISVICLGTYIPLSLFLTKNLELGIYGIVLANILINMTVAFIWPIQYHKIMNNTNGIWTK